MSRDRGPLYFCGIVAAAALLSGCVFGPGKAGFSLTNPGSWFSHREASSADRAEARADAAAEKVDAARDDLLRAAQREVHRGALAIAEETMLSRPVVITTDAVGNAAAALDQALGPIPAEQMMELRQRVAALLSEVEAVRTAAEQAQARDTAALLDAARQLAAAQARAAELQEALDLRQAELRKAFDRENALANKQRALQWAAGFGIGFSVLAGIAALYAKFTYGGGLKSIVGAIDSFRKTRGDSDPGVSALLTKLNDWMTDKEKALVKKVRGAAS
jgi:hypothetical protein